jgi:hypothetical protein
MSSVVSDDLSLGSRRHRRQPGALPDPAARADGDTLTG